MNILTFKEFLDNDFIDEIVDPIVTKQRRKAKRDFLKGKKLVKKPPIHPQEIDDIDHQENIKRRLKWEF